jgi:DNA-binding NarL/FixJ family response regulator
MRVLIAESSTVVREKLVSILGDLKGIEVVGQAQDAPSARALARDTKPDVTIMDSLDAAGDSIGLLQYIKAIRPDSKVIVLTNFVEPENRDMCYRNGADYFFDKSIEFEEAIAVIRNLLSHNGNNSIH